jgi:hypothetical protein
MSKIGFWEFKVWTDESCLNCTNLMRDEWYSFAGDDIQICHACYSNDTLRKYGYEQV